MNHNSYSLPKTFIHKSMNNSSKRSSMKLLLTFLFYGIFFQIQAQEKSEIGLSFLNGKNELVSFGKTEGAPSYSGEGFYSFGVNYLKELKTWLYFETGLEYSSQKFRITPNLPPDMDRSPRFEKTGLLSIPLVVRLKFLKLAFLNAGLLLDMDASLSNSIDNQSGVGVLMGVGLKYDFKSGISLTINPCTRMHSLISFSTDSYQHHIIDSGLKFGIGYQF